MAKADKRLALVTGANKGIGFEVSRQLAGKGLRVILTSRDAKKGLQAQKALAKEGLEVLCHELDVTRRRSVAALARYLAKEHGRVDVLVNNAGILIDRSATSVLDEKEDVFHTTLETNFFGALRMCQAVVPLMQKHRYGRVVNLSSGLGQLDDMGDGNAAYRTSKTVLNALTRMVATATAGDNVLVNSMCPGWVRTDMGGPAASRSVEKGAETAVWLAMLPDSGPTGGFFRDKKPIPW
ncbi:MAG: SDR family oxidoreductase [Betaproteobacteria bacterium]|nr:SDR family oxidoreductase [Betaproteobacteria bacterium]